MWNVAVIGGGIAGLTAAYTLEKAAEHAGKPLSWCLVEGSADCGGKIRSERHGPFLVEAGPDAVIPQKPWALELMRELGLGERLLPSNDAARTTFVHQGSHTGGRLVPLPPGLGMLVPGDARALLASPLFSWPGKLRMLAERFVPARPHNPDGDDESVADFVRRRLGREAVKKLAEPLLGHIYMADVERMSLEATYPKLRQAELQAGSLTAALRAARKAGRLPFEGPLFYSLRGGMQELVAALVAQLPPEALLVGHRVRSLEPVDGGKGYRLTLDDGSVHTAETVVLAVPSFVAAELVEPFDAELAARFAAIRYVSLATLSLGFRREDVGRKLDGFGYFNLTKGRRTILASTWTSTKWEHRSDGEHVLVRLFLGEPGSEELLGDDEEIVARAVAELSEVLGTTAPPVFQRLHRWPRGYPQYEVGHRERVAAIEAGLPPGLAVAGSPYHGVGLPDCVRSARAAAEGVLERFGVHPAPRGRLVDGAPIPC